MRRSFVVNALLVLVAFGWFCYLRMTVSGASGDDLMNLHG
jgi:hypothetical protein